MGKAIFLGRPGVLYPRVKIAEDFESYNLYDDVPKSLALLGNMEFSIVIVGNSKNDEYGASYRGAYDRSTEAIRYTTPSSVVINSCYHGNEDCVCKLPSPKLLFQAIEEYDFDVDESFMIAGYPIDFEAAKSAGIKDIVLLTTAYKKWSNTIEEFALAKVTSFSKAVRIIQDLLLIDITI